TSHSTPISGLSNGTSYNYYVKCQDTALNTNVSDYTISFNVSSPSSGGGGGGGGGGGSPVYNPIISAIKTSTITNSSATISWTTDLSSTTQIAYGTSSIYSQQSQNNSFVTSHILTINNLIPLTLYHFQVKSFSSTGSATSSDQTFQTLAVTIPTNPNNPPVVTPTSPGSSTTLINNKGTYYLIANNTRQGITNPGILLSYGFEFKDARTATAADLSLPIGANLNPDEGALVKTKADPTVYMISAGQRHGFTSATVFGTLGYKFSSVLTVTTPELNNLPIGAIVNSSTIQHPKGTNILYKGVVYWISGTDLRPYTSIAIFNEWNKDNDFSSVVPANSADLALPFGVAVVGR
ncbi:MAG: Fibronectin, type domain protein, partial [Candidatus Doudnabacteria bacterium]|nr:Fibronectin, type domain protein [Candidatus Doudnabacteria bacterium]